MKTAFLLICPKTLLKTVLIEKAIVTHLRLCFLMLDSPEIHTFERKIGFSYNKVEERTVAFMREKLNHLYVDSGERTLLLQSLVELKNQLIQQGRYTDCVDELIFKVINAPVKKLKIVTTGG